jgi:hypothetical protein
MGSAESLLAAAGRFVHKDVLMALAAADAADARLGALGAVSDAVLRRTRSDEPGSS